MVAQYSCANALERSSGFNRDCRDVKHEASCLGLSLLTRVTFKPATRFGLRRHEVGRAVGVNTPILLASLHDLAHAQRSAEATAAC